MKKRVKINSITQITIVILSCVKGSNKINKYALIFLSIVVT